jgi:peptidoglycan/LPS O-acetylase OafA/YrhL
MAIVAAEEQSIAPAERPVRPGSYYRPELDVLRFGAFLLVFLFHVLPDAQDPRVDHFLGHYSYLFYAAVSACRFGLTLFFTLSAFLIAELLMRERGAVGTVSIKRFYIRRILRIWPLYYFALLLWFGWWMMIRTPHGEAQRLGWYAIFLGSLYEAVRTSAFTPISPLWSISIEEQFYVCVPWVMKYAKEKLIYLFCFATIVIASLVLFFDCRSSFTAEHSWFYSPVQFECFAAGILLSLLLRRRVPQWGLGPRVVTLLSCAVTWMMASLMLARSLDAQISGPRRGLFLVVGYALTTTGSILLLISALGVKSALLPSWAIYLGRISFGLYVYHAFAIRLLRHVNPETLHLIAVHPYPLRAVVTLLVTMVLPFLVTFAMAYLSYRFLESPILRMKKRYEVIDSQPVLATT